jgi:DNA-binding XRE family transcriptional regulator
MNIIKRIRSQMKISQATIAREAKIDVRYFQRIEKGDQIPTVYIALNIARVLHTTVEDLFN